MYHYEYSTTLIIHLITPILYVLMNNVQKSVCDFHFVIVHFLHVLHPLVFSLALLAAVILEAF